MIASYLRLLKFTLTLTLFLPLVATVCSRLASQRPPDGGFWLKCVLAGSLTAAASVVAARLLSLLQPTLERHGERQAAYLDGIEPRFVGLAIAASAAVSLFLELAMIRWQGTVWEVFAFYKNFGLLSCFAGLGLGYALAQRAKIPLLMVIPLLAYQFALLLGLRHGMAWWRLRCMMTGPVHEQLSMGLDVGVGLPSYAAIYALLGAVLLMTALAFIPIGQLCGRLIDRTDRLRGYGLNLLGSLVGVALVTLTSFLMTPPPVWFALCFLVVLWFLQYDREALLWGGVAVLAAFVVLTWPVAFGYERIYSPYQLLERGPGGRGLMMIRAAGNYYQRVHDLSVEAQRAYPDRRDLAAYYELPYVLRGEAREVAIVGAGTGNDVAAALRRGAERVDAIDIDSVIMALGASYHPERPYHDPRVSLIVDDARTFLRRTTKSYDLVVYGLLDSHTLLSHASSVRLDSFVYTVEGLRDARRRLRPGGVLCLSFAALSREIGRKIFLMMQAAFDGNPPVCIFARCDDGAVVFAQSRDGGLQLDPEALLAAGLADSSAAYADASIRADVSTDDWPFFYMPQRVYPVSYLWMAGLTLVLSAGIVRCFIVERPRVDHAAFGFMGAGFMLVETKGITELGLVFGNTWVVIGVVIAAILVMAFMANAMVRALGLENPVAPLVLVLASLGAGLALARCGGFSASSGGQLASVVVLTCPLFFSGMAFSTMLARSAELSGALAMNLFGATLGGLLEYNSMYFGFQFLYWIAMGLYLAALVATVTSRRPGGCGVPDGVTP